MPEKLIKTIKVYTIGTIIFLILLFGYLSRGYFSFYNKNFVSIDQVKATAIEAIGGGDVVFIETDFFGVIPHYDVNVRYENLIYKVEINAKTGVLKSFELDN